MLFARKQRSRLNIKQTHRLRHPCQRVWSFDILKPNIAGPSYCCCGVAKETAKLTRVSQAAWPNQAVCPVASVVCTLIWPTYRPRYVHSCGNRRCTGEVFQRKCGGGNARNVSGFYATWFHVSIWCSRLDVDEEETMSFDVVRLLFHYIPRSSN